MTSDRSRYAKMPPDSDPPDDHQTGPTDTQDVPQRQRYHQRSRSHRSASLPVASGSSRDPDTLLDAFGRMDIATQPYNSQSINVILFGEPGVGKSAVVNLIACGNIARVPSDTDVRTLQSTCYNISVDNVNVCIFETMGLGEPEITGRGYLSALEKAYELTTQLSATGGVHLLLFCISATRLTAVTQSNYRLFSEVVFPTQVPIALVFTGLEGEARMEDWWTRNKSAIERYGFLSDGHACITTVTDRTYRQDLNYRESQKRIRELLKSCFHRTSVLLPEPLDWFIRLGNEMQAFVNKYEKPTRGDLTNVLSIRLKLDQQTVKRFLDTMERGDAQSSSRDGGGWPQDAPFASVQYWNSKGEVDFAKPDQVPNSRDPYTVKWTDEPQTTGIVDSARPWQVLDPGRWDSEPWKGGPGEMGMAQYRGPSGTGEEQMWGWDDGTRRRKIKAGKAKAEPRTMNAPAEQYVKSETSVSMNDIRSNFPHDLTGYVTRSTKYPIASGSYGDIYRGKFNMRGRFIDVAIKVYKIQMYAQRDESMSEKMKLFLKEIRVWLKLDHPNVLQLFGTIRDPKVHPSIPAMVCPWVVNGALSGYLERNMDLTASQRLILVNDVAYGLQYLHSREVVHGDLSGSNVLVDGNGRACIADFGLSRLLTAISGQSFVTSPPNRGTVRWMAPELLDPDSSRPSGPTMQSDVYSFGSLMLQILTGNIPYHRYSRDEQVIYAIWKGARPDRSDHKAVTDGRWNFIKCCWSSDIPRPSSDEIVQFVEWELSENWAVRT